MLKKQYLKDKPACKVTFVLPKAAVNGAKEVRVLGTFNDWTWSTGTPMAFKKSTLEAVVELEAGRQYEFRYLIDNTTWITDGEADGYIPTPFGVDNAVVALEPVAVKAKAEKKAPAAKKEPAVKKEPVAKKAPAAKKAPVAKKAAVAAEPVKKAAAPAKKAAAKATAAPAATVKKTDSVKKGGKK
ncbi:MAG TPA: isoamylase early set domain-containing protein [Flavilitoribacter sp.]|nr:isoamylase early set domain-containing protein [Flavilitoribacter sp.]HMQ86165.1 isoamylase early set domain-containing protein [Flavilitoribacter sp.]